MDKTRCTQTKGRLWNHSCAEGDEELLQPARQLHKRTERSPQKGKQEEELSEFLFLLYLKKKKEKKLIQHTEERFSASKAEFRIQYLKMRCLK